VEIRLGPSFPENLITGVTCNSHEVEYVISDGTLRFEIEPSVLNDKAAVQLCLVKFGTTTPTMLEGDRSFPNAISFGAPWIISKVSM
jgi:hypothetical protein